MELLDFIKKFMIVVNEEKQETVIPVMYKGEKYFLWFFEKDGILVGSLERKSLFNDLGEVLSIIHERIEDGKLRHVKIGFIDQEIEFEVVNED